MEIYQLLYGRKQEPLLSYLNPNKIGYYYYYYCYLCEFVQSCHGAQQYGPNLNVCVLGGSGNKLRQSSGKHKKNCDRTGL